MPASVGAEEFFLPIGLRILDEETRVLIPLKWYDTLYLADRWGWTPDTVNRLSYPERAFYVEQRRAADRRQAAKNGTGSKP